jgi:four helix bundle protein
MATIQSFEDIDAWQKARQLSKMVYEYTKQDAFKKDYGLCDQIRRAAVSVMSNIAEGFDRSGNKEFIQFLFIAKGSTAEIESQLYVALDNGYINEEQFTEVTSLTNVIKSLLSGFIRYLKKSDMKGYKFKNIKPQT